MKARQAAFLLFAATLIWADARPAFAQTPDTLVETYSDWTVRCAKPDDSGRRCWMVQTLNQTNGGERVLQLEFAFREEKFRMVLLAPFGLLLNAGATFSVDGTEGALMNFRTCLPAGCVVEVEPDADFMAALRRGNQLSVRLTVARTEEPLNLNLSLTGFSAAFNRLTALSAA